jgi:DNA-binding NarL/FixJ family response regulator
LGGLLVAFVISFTAITVVVLGILAAYAAVTGILYAFAYGSRRRIAGTPLARIVLADNHEVVRTGIRTVLESNPALSVCAVAKDGQEAIDKVLEFRPELVILDLTMPVLGGFQAAVKIRQLLPRIKILILAIHATALLEQVAYLMGADNYPTKTPTREELMSTVMLLLQEGSSAPKTSGFHRNLLFPPPNRISRKAVCVGRLRPALR